tara:strand:- start:51 stop:233 length:183 start_codon:yes stop_codon:yes gene_type:complete
MTGEELKKLRVDKGMSQGRLAELLGYYSKGVPNRSMIARFENGHASINIRIANLIRIILK